MTPAELKLVMAERQHWKDRALKAERELARALGVPWDPIRDFETGQFFDRETGEEWVRDLDGDWLRKVERKLDVVK